MISLSSKNIKPIQIENAISYLAKQQKISKEEVRKIIERNSQENTFNIRDSQFRYQVNQWWQEYKKQLPNMGLGILKNIPHPSQLPEPTYEQICNLVMITEKFKTKEFIKKELEKVKMMQKAAPKPRLALRQRIYNFFAEILDKIVQKFDI